MRLCWLFFIYPILSSLLSFFFFFLFLSIYLLRFWYLSQSQRPLDLNILFASSLPLHNNVKHASNNRKENGRERARAEEIEAKFFFFLSWLCPISSLFFLMNFWISFIALQIRNDPFLRIWEDLFVTRLAREFDGAFHRSIGSMYASTHA